MCGGSDVNRYDQIPSVKHHPHAHWLHCTKENKEPLSPTESFAKPLPHARTRIHTTTLNKMPKHSRDESLMPDDTDAQGAPSNTDHPRIKEERCDEVDYLLRKPMHDETEADEAVTGSAPEGNIKEEPSDEWEEEEEEEEFNPAPPRSSKRRKTAGTKVLPQKKAATKSSAIAKSSATTKSSSTKSSPSATATATAAAANAKGTAWTADEDALLLALKHHTPMAWNEIAAAISTHDNKSCQNRYGKLKKEPNLFAAASAAGDSKTWTPAQDAMLKALRRAGKPWREIADIIPGRDSKSCQNRWGKLKREGVVTD
ncbi:hypothetical protein BC938DRAFT_478593 [Jimgerdemannia flammicorona]|uniref:Myb-like domain-containing protein n=1 Tax=Jimgerdemannia flammicorona TaxID=994334 RepID=A0A433P552_9FUNG|nr:hypothetical protein BC938DRAFT_478593 [Jimgerdemannia flammicorona]